MIQASPREIRSALTNLHAFELDSYYRIFNVEYKKYLLALILANISAESLDMNSVSLVQIVSLINDTTGNEMEDEQDTVPENVVRALLSSVSVTSANHVYSLSTYKIGRFIAFYLFDTQQSSFELNKFIELWNKALPIHIDFDMTMIKGSTFTFISRKI